MLDSDDFITDDTLNFLGLCLDYNKKWSAVACDYFTVNFAGKKLKRFSFEKRPIACGILYRKSKLFQIGLYNPKLRLILSIYLYFYCSFLGKEDKISSLHNKT